MKIALFYLSIRSLISKSTIGLGMSFRKATPESESFRRELGDTIAELREKKELSQEDVAAALDITRETVSNYELGKGSNIDIYYRLITYLGGNINISNIKNCSCTKEGRAILNVIEQTFNHWKPL